MADALGLGPSGRKALGVQVLLPAPNKLLKAAGRPLLTIYYSNGFLSKGKEAGDL